MAKGGGWRTCHVAKGGMEGMPRGHARGMEGMPRGDGCRPLKAGRTRERVEDNRMMASAVGVHRSLRSDSLDSEELEHNLLRRRLQRR